MVVHVGMAVNVEMTYKVCPESNETYFLWQSRRVGEWSLRA
jgi:hypothetical protein